MLSGDAVETIALVVGLALAFLVTLTTTPLARTYARRRGVVDKPEARRVNKRAVARGGGIAIAAGFVSVSALMLVLNFPLGLQFVDQPPGVGAGQIAALLLGAALAVGIGLLDDFYQLRARWQLLGQLALAATAVVLGVTVTNVNFPFVAGGTLHIGSLPTLLVGPVAGAVTVLWIVGMVNSINFIDGLDGLSTGIALIAAVTLGLISLGVGTDEPEPLIALFCFILAGALAGFLRWNFHPASIFSGTSGIMFVGYSLAVLSILGAAKIAVALLVLGVPIMDTFWIIVRRTLARRSPFAPDRGHIHHRLLDMGLSHRNTVLVIYGVCGMLAILSLVLSVNGQMYAFLGLIVVFGLVLFLIERLGGGAAAIQESLDADSYVGGEGGSGGEGGNGKGGGNGGPADPFRALSVPSSDHDDHDNPGGSRVSPLENVRPAAVTIGPDLAKRR
jgi:UDP-GlcNAc:undecaprenyl-phosphate GlcNAc-1-phosphate transferase